MPQVTGPLETTDPTDTYPTHDALLGLGGLREVADHAARNAIPDARRREGMVTFTRNDQRYWKLEPSPWDGTDADWSSFTQVSSGSRYVHHQDVPDEQWVVNHGLGAYPSVTAVDSAGVVIEGSQQYIDTMTVIITFGSAFGGLAYVN